jgi:hypothetical protein
LAHQIDGDVTCFWDFDDRVIGSGVQEGSHSSIQTGTTAQVRYSASASSGNSTTDTIQLVENEDNRRAVFRVEVTVDAEGESPLLGQSGSSITMARDIRVALSEIVGPALESTSDPVEMVENLHSIRNLASSAYDAMHNVYPATGANHPFFWTELTQEEVDGNADNMNGLEAGDGEGQYRLLVTSGGGPGEFAARAVTFTTGISTTGSACVYAVFLSDHFWTSSEEPNVASTHIISAIVDHEEKHVYQLADTRENGDTFWHRLFKDLFSGGTQDYTQFWEAEGSTAELSSEIDWFWATPSNPFGSIVAQLKIKYEAALVELNNISSGAVKTESEVFLRNLYASFPGWFRLSHLDPMFVDLLYIRPPS